MKEKKLEKNFQQIMNYYFVFIFRQFVIICKSL